MSTFLWVLAGGMLGWIAYAYLDLSQGRGQLVSVIIGAMGGVLGGKLVAPMFIAASETPGDFSAATMAIAVMASAGVLLLGHFVYDKWDI